MCFVCMVMMKEGCFVWSSFAVLVGLLFVMMMEFVLLWRWKWMVLNCVGRVEGEACTCDILFGGDLSEVLIEGGLC